MTAEATPLHIGRRSSVWQTRVTNAEGRLLALVIQTQMTLEAWPWRSPAQRGGQAMT